MSEASSGEVQLRADIAPGLHWFHCFSIYAHLLDVGGCRQQDANLLLCAGFASDMGEGERLSGQNGGGFCGEYAVRCGGLDDWFSRGLRGGEFEGCGAG